MTTEVQIRKSRSHLPYLRRILSSIASRLGMDSAEISAAECAVDDACLSSISSESDSQGNLVIRFDASDSCMTIEITDPALTPSFEESDILTDRLAVGVDVDGIEYLESSICKTIRISRPLKIRDAVANRVSRLSLFGVVGTQC